MFTGNTISELMGMVVRAEANAESRHITEAEMSRYMTPAYTVYSYEQLKQFERESAFMGVA